MFYVRGMGGEDGASPRASRRGDEQGDRDAPQTRGHRYEAEGESAARAAGGAVRDERGTRVRTAGRARRRAWWSWVWAWWSWVWAWWSWVQAWWPWVLWATRRGVYLAVLGPVLGPILGAVCGPAGRRPTPPGLCRTCPTYLVLLRESPRVLPVYATVPRRLATGHPTAAV